jgi:hypothetical protein
MYAINQIISKFKNINITKEKKGNNNIMIINGKKYTNEKDFYNDLRYIVNQKYILNHIQYLK